MKIPINVITSNKDTFNIFLWPLMNEHKKGIHRKEMFGVN